VEWRDWEGRDREAEGVRWGRSGRPLARCLLIGLLCGAGMGLHHMCRYAHMQTDMQTHVHTHALWNESINAWAMRFLETERHMGEKLGEG
jgi:hypothetical protein